MRLVDILVPAALEGTQASLARWLKQPGAPVAADEPVAELETDKVAMEVVAPVDGTLHACLVERGAPLVPGAVLGHIAEGGDAAPEAAPVRAAEVSIARFDPALRLSPSVRRLLLETGADPRAIAGTGRGGRVTRADVETHLAGRPAAVRQQSAGASRRVPHDAMRRRIADHMARSLATAPHVTAVMEADFSAINAHRRAHAAEFEKQGVRLTSTAYLIAASVQAMAAAPAVNARYYEDALEYFDEINIGVGTATPDGGLLVPVVHRAQTLSLLGIAARLQDMTDRARNGKLIPADMQGGTFSISNHGVSGSLIAAPIIINQPQSAILGVGKMEKRVVVREVDGVDTIQIRPMAYVSLSIDHRVLDGQQTNAWLTRFVEVIEGWTGITPA